MMTRQETAGHAAAIITILIWGTTFISTKVLLADFSPIAILFYRFLLGFFVLLAVRPRLIPIKSWREELLFAGAGLSGVTLYFLLENIALTYTYASNVGIIVSIIPMITAVLAHFILEGESLRLSFFTGFATALTGLLCITFNGNAVLHLNPLGDVLATAAAIVFAFYSIFMKSLSTRRYHTIELTQRVFLYGLVFMIPFLYIFDFRQGSHAFASLSNIFNMLYLGIGASAVCFVTWNYSVSVLGAVKTSAYIYIVPVVTITASVVFLQEKMTWIALAGGALILCGLYMSEMKPRPKQNTENVK